MPAASIDSIASAMPMVEALGMRFVGALIDVAVLAAYEAICIYLFIGATSFGVVVVGILLMLGGPLAYFIVGEAIWGRSLGKLAVGPVVVNGRGKPPGFIKSTIRTLTRLVEVNPLLFGAIPAGFFVLLSDTRRRMGDSFAGTYVIPLKELKSFEEGKVFS